jgi:hypothetical protein
MKKKKDEAYCSTLKGLIYSITQDEQLTDKLWDAIDLYGLRNKKNAIILVDGGTFAVLEEK